MRLLVVAVLAIASSLVVVLGTATLLYGAPPSGSDAVGFVFSTAATGVVLVAALHWPVLAALRRRGVTLTPGSAGMIAAAGINAPIYAILASIGRKPALFAGGEAMLLALGFAAAGLVFGAGYAKIHHAPQAARRR
jgi:hypothetical protein